MTRFLMTGMLLLLTAPPSRGQTGNKRAVLVHTVAFKYLEGCETGTGDCKPVLLKRHSPGDSLVLVFPAGGTLSDV